MSHRDRSPSRRRHRPRDRRADARAPRRARRLLLRPSTPFGGASIDAHGIALTDEVAGGLPRRRRRAARRGRRPEVGHHRRRTRRAPSRACSACARSSGCSPTCARSGRSRRCADASPLKDVEGVDLLVVRELTGGIYFGEKTRTADSASRPVRLHARGDRADRPRRLPRRAQRRSRASTRPTCSRPRRLWREVVTDVHAEEFPDIELEHQLVDSARCSSSPRRATST